MLKEAVTIVRNNKLASTVFWLPVVGAFAAGGVLAIQYGIRYLARRHRKAPATHDRRPAENPDELTPEERDTVERLANAWKYQDSLGVH